MNYSKSHSGWTIALGISLLILGIITLSAQVFTTLVSLVFLGWMLAIGGIGEFFYGFFSGSFGRAILYFIGGIVTFVIGASIVLFPGISALTITFLIGMYMLLIGMYKTLSSLFVRYPSWGWNFASGIVSFILGAIIFAGWPVSGLWVIGLFIGVELFVRGFAMTLDASKPEYRERKVYHDSAYMSGAKGGKSGKEKKD